MKRLALLLSCAIAAMCGAPALADSVVGQGPITLYGPQTATPSAIVNLSGQGLCATTITGTATGISVTAQGSANNGVTFAPIASYPAIASNGVYAASISLAAVTNFQLLITTTGGNLTYSISCSTSSGNATATDANNRAIVTGAGTPGSPAGGVSSIQGVSGGVPVPVTGTFSSTTTFPYPASAGAATPSSFLGASGVYNTTLPALTAGQVAPLPLDASSRLIISPTGLPTPLATQPVSGTVTVGNPSAFPTPQPLPTDASGWQKVSLWNGSNQAYLANPALTGNAITSVPSLFNLSAPCISNGATCDVWTNGGTPGVPLVQLGAGSATIGKVTSAQPYSGATAQPTQAASFVGVGTVNAAGTAYNPLIGDSNNALNVTLHKNTTILTTTPLGASGVYTSPWMDTTADNTTTVNVASYSNVVTSSEQIQESNDTTGLTGTYLVATTAPSASTYGRLTAVITARYWRVVYTNGGAAQTSFEIAYTTSSAPPGAYDPYGDQKVGLYTSAGLGIAGNNFTSDGSNTSNIGIATQAVCYAYNGTALDRCRKDTYANGPLWLTDGGSFTTPIPAAAGNVVVKSSPGRIVRMTVYATGTAGNVLCYDNATTNSGTVIGVIAGAATVGTVALFNNVAAYGITCASSATSPAVTVSAW